MQLVGGSIFVPVVNDEVSVLRPEGISVAGRSIVVVDGGVAVIASAFGEFECFKGEVSW